MYFETKSAKWHISASLKCAKTPPHYKSLFVVCRVEYQWYDIKNVSLVQNSAQPFQCIWPILCWTWDQVSMHGFDPPFFNTTTRLTNFALTKINSDKKKENSWNCSIYKAWKKYQTRKFRQIISQRASEKGFISKERLNKEFGRNCSTGECTACHTHWGEERARAWLLCSAVVSMTETGVFGRADVYTIAIVTQRSTY